MLENKTTNNCLSQLSLLPADTGSQSSPSPSSPSHSLSQSKKHRQPYETLAPIHVTQLWVCYILGKTISSSGIFYFFNVQYTKWYTVANCDLVFVPREIGHEKWMWLNEQVSQYNWMNKSGLWQGQLRISGERARYCLEVCTVSWQQKEKRMKDVID